MSAQENLWQATTCYFGEQVKEGRVIAIATYTDRRRICFLLNGEIIGQWVPEEALYGSVSSFNFVDKETFSSSLKAKKESASSSFSSLEVEKEAKQEAKDDVNTLVKIVKNHQQLVLARSVEDIEKISGLLQTVISGLEVGAKLVVDAVSSPDKVVRGLLETVSLIVKVKDQILKAVNEMWSRYWKERVLTLIKGKKVHYSTSEKIVDQLRNDYRGKTNRQLAEHIVFEKAVYTSITGFIQGLIISCAGKPPEATISDFLAGKKGFESLHQLLNNPLVNFFDTNSLLVEMIYQISLIYDIKSGEGDILVILATVLTKKVADFLEMQFLIGPPSHVKPLVPAVKNMLVFMVVGYIAIDCYETQKETGKMPIGSLEALLSLQDRAFAYLTETSSKGSELEQALANAISVEAVAVPELLSAVS